MKVSCRIQKIDQWYDNTWLKDTFEKVLTETDAQSQEVFFFENIYVPFRNVIQVTEGGETTYVLSETWEYENCGWDSDDVTDAYWSQFGWCFFPEYFNTASEFTTALNSNKCKVAKLINAAFRQNKLKYKKMIELAGFAYDPLRNVDAHEMHSEFEVHGDEERKSAHATGGATQTTMLNTHAVSTYDGSPKTEYTDSVDVPAGTSHIQPTAGVQIDNINVVAAAGTDVEKPNNVSSGAIAGYDKTIHDTAKNGVTNDTEFTVNAEDNAFGQALKGADYYKAVKDRRYGNIGVTKTQELLEAERENLRFNLLQEFFRDINKVVLIGVK